MIKFILVFSDTLLTMPAAQQSQTKQELVSQQLSKHLELNLMVAHSQSGPVQMLLPIN